MPHPPQRDIVFAEELQGRDYVSRYLVTLICGHRKFTSIKAASYPCLNCPAEEGEPVPIPCDTRVEIKTVQLSSVELDRTHVVFRIKIYNADGMWQEEYKTADDVRAFLRGAQAYASLHKERIDLPDEWR